MKIRNLRLLYRQSQNKGVEERPFFKFYQEGVDKSLNNQLSEANELFNRSLEEIRNSNQDFLQHYTYILKRIAHNQRRMGQYPQAEKTLYNIIKHKKEKNISSALVYEDYDNLFKHLLFYDVNKATKLAKALLSEKERIDMPNISVKLFEFNLANAYLLSGNYQDAKRKYSQMLDANPQGNLKSYAFNNLGLACWWHKNPPYIENDGGSDSHRIQKDYDKCKELFNKSIQISQKVKEIQDQSKVLAFNEVLSLENPQFNKDIQFTSPASLYPLVNRAYHLLENDPLQKAEILFWLNQALRLSQVHKNSVYFDRIFVELSLVTNALEPLFEHLPELIEKYRSNQNFVEEIFYCRTLGALLIQKGKNDQSSQYMARFNQLSQVLPKWVSKFKYLAMDRLDLIQ